MNVDPTVVNRSLNGGTDPPIGSRAEGFVTNMSDTDQ